MNQIDHIMALADECAKAFKAADTIQGLHFYIGKQNALRAAIEQALTPGEPVAWANYANLQSAAVTRNRGGQGDTHTWSETPTAYHNHPLYTGPQPQPKQEPASEGTLLREFLAEAKRAGVTHLQPQQPAEQPQPKQEPVAWQPIETAPKDGSTVIIGRDMGDFGFVRGYGRFDGTEGEFCSGWISHGFSEYQGNLGLAHPTHWMPLPPAPDAAPHPQREWVGLTDGEWQDLSDKYGLIIFGRFKIEIEAKLREKNGGGV